MNSNEGSEPQPPPRMCENEEYDGMCEKCCDGRGDIELCLIIFFLQGVAHGCTLSPNLVKVCINDHIIVAVEAAKDAVTVGHDTVSGLTCVFG